MKTLYQIFLLRNINDKPKPNIDFISEYPTKQKSQHKV